MSSSNWTHLRALDGFSPLPPSSVLARALSRPYAVCPPVVVAPCVFPFLLAHRASSSIPFKLAHKLYSVPLPVSHLSCRRVRALRHRRLAALLTFPFTRSAGLAGFEQGFVDEEPCFASTIRHVLRIALRVLEIQDIFLDVLLPLLHEFDSALLIGIVHQHTYLTCFDQVLS
ncbi:hypothetical protein B0H15DRAFT_952627 [Mycena belliarum]|uniref:Uncharacterized protein n=1 Tax=Mycena belliarum TaxID=1033014 RepID=A0AAD6XNI7_9AGAR|nr:hypothetical protein B0H15DRAFT_952627 [Mycena belliae]